MKEEMESVGRGDVGKRKEAGIVPGKVLRWRSVRMVD